MPKLACLCGFVHNLSPIPDQGWVTIRDKDYEELIKAEIIRETVAGQNGLPSNDHPRVTEYNKATEVCVRTVDRMYECPKCGRVMWEKPGQKSYTIYTKDI